MRHLHISAKQVGLVVSLVLLGCDDQPGVEEYRKALESMRDGNYVVGRSLMEKSLRLQPREAPAATGYNYLGIAYLNLGNNDKAKKAFHMSRQLDASLLEPVYNLGVLTYREGDYPLASQLFQEAAKFPREQGRSFHYAGVAELNQRNWLEAERLFEAALLQQPNSAQIQSSLALARLRTKGPHRAILDLGDATRTDPNYGPAYFNLALIHTHWLGETQVAREALERFLVKSTDENRIQEAKEMLASVRSVTDVSKVHATGHPLPDLHDLSPSDGASSNTLSGLSVPDSRQVEIVSEPNFGARSMTNRTQRPMGRPPASAIDFMKQAEHEAARGRTQTALETFRRAAVMAEQHKDLALEERILKAATLSCPDQAGSYFDFGRFLYRMGEYGQALKAYKKAMALDPSSSAALVGLAEAAIKTGQFESAAVAFERSLRLDSGNSNAMWYLALLYDRHLKDPDEAINSYREFVQKFAVDERAAEAMARLTQLEAQVRDEQQADRFVIPVEVTSDVVGLDEVVEPGPDRDPDRHTALFTESNPPPQETVQVPQSDQTLVSEFRGPTRNSKSAADWYQRGLLYKARNDWRNAEEHFRKATELDDTFEDAYLELGDVYRKQGNPRNALQTYRHVLVQNPRLVAPRYNVALIYHEADRNEAALVQIKEILSIQPNHAPSHYLLGVMYAEHPKTQHLAAKHFRLFVRLAPNDEAAAPVRTWLNQHGVRQ